jgi:L-alanine-DL-glutamate epimerase-like enolase superfamily enzyme
MGLIDILQTDISHAGGISGLWEIGATAAFSGISMAPHACEGPIGGLSTIHVDAATPNFVVQEICGQVKANAADKIWDEWFGFPAMRIVNGRFPSPKSPGWVSSCRKPVWRNSLLAHETDGACVSRGRLSSGMGTNIRLIFVQNLAEIRPRNG